MKDLGISETKATELPDIKKTDNEALNQAMGYIRDFELTQMSYNLHQCKSCQEIKITENQKKAKDSLCQRCQHDKNEIKMFSPENLMDPGDVPEELLNLTVIEQQLICKISPAINVHMLKHGGIGSSGHCVTFPQAIDEPAQIFPRLPAEISLIRVRKQGKNDTTKAFTVRRKKVENALLWLKNNNPVYSNIIISNDRLQLLPENGELQSIKTVEFKENTVHDNDVGPAPDQINIHLKDENTHSGILLADPPTDIREKVKNIVQDITGNVHASVTQSKRKLITIPWPTRDNMPVPEFTTITFFSQAFPTLFPYGKGDFNINRPRTCDSMADWAEHLLWYKDGRFAKHEYFKFIVHNIIMRKRALDESSYIVKQKIGEDHLCVDDLKKMLENGDESLPNKILYFGSNLRGSAQYWKQRAHELRALIQYQINNKKGLPSFFSTGSCAEYYFKPLRRLLEIYIENTTNEHLDLNDKNVLFSVLQKHTHIVAQYFDMRTKCYFEKIMRPVFGVDTFWYRQEFAKSRGMIHWHALCWRGDRNPHSLIYEAKKQNMSDVQLASEVSKWAEEIFAMKAMHPAGSNMDGTPNKNLWPPPEGNMPPPPDDENPLFKLLMDVSNSQDSVLEDYLYLTNRVCMHRCSDYCYRKRGKEIECRMGFGSKSKPGKEIQEQPLLIKDKNGCLRLEMERDHPSLVQSSRIHLQTWRANGDVSIILSESDPDSPSYSEIIATERYVSGYACKGNVSTSAISDLFKDIVNSVDAQETSAKSLCSKLLMNSIKRDVSAVEVSYELCRLPLYRSSHQFQFVSLTGARMLETTGETATKSTTLDKYCKRDPKDASSWYQYICNSGKVPVIAGSHIRASWPLTDEYCRAMMLLHWPNWRKISDIKDNNTSWTSSFNEFLSGDTCPLSVKADVERAKSGKEDEMSDEESEYDNINTQEEPDWMDLIQPCKEYPDEEESMLNDGGPDYDWSRVEFPCTEKDIENWSCSISEHLLQFYSEELRLPDVSLKSMNNDQMFAFNLVLSRLLEYKENPDQFNNHMRLIISGTAGSGKSYLINCLVKAIRLLFKTNNCVQVVCPTGNSANLIQGTTIHSFFKIPVESRKLQEMKQPDGTVGVEIQKNCEGLEALIVDERSMVGCRLLGYMEHHCTFGVRGNEVTTSVSWGGIPVVIFLGDDVQLPPVCDTPVYMDTAKGQAAMHGSLIWKDFTTALELKVMVRQKSDEFIFKDVLLSCRTYDTSPTQAKWLQNFQWEELRAKYGSGIHTDMQENGLFVFPTHREEANHNLNKLKEANQLFPVAKLTAVSSGAHKNVPSEKACGLQQCLYICKGAKVLLTANINIEYGLYNGSPGIIKDIYYTKGTNPRNSLPSIVYVEFNKYDGPPFINTNPKVVPLKPQERKIDCYCHGCKRKQFPLRLGWGTTIHKCQGLTIGEGEANQYIVINPGPVSFEARNPGAFFVALSRAKQSGTSKKYPDFAFGPNVLVNFDRLCCKINTKTTIMRKKEIERIAQLSESTKKKYDHLNSLSCFTQIIQLIDGIELEE